MSAAGRLREFLAACPFACPAIAVASSIAWCDTGDHGWSLLALTALFLSFFSRPKVWLVTAVLALLAGGLHIQRVSEQRAVAALHGDWWEGEMEVASELRSGRVELEFVSSEFSGQRVQAWLGRSEYQLTEGDRVEVKGRMLAPRERLNPDVFPEGEWLRRKGIHAVYIVRELEAREGAGARRVLQSMATTVKGWVSGRMDQGAEGDEQNAAIVKAMVLGERPQEATDIIDAFRKSGTIHVFAVSGLHVMMVGSIVAVFLRILGCPRWLWIPLVIASLFFYALVTGMRPPAMRAAMMGAVLLSTWLVRRRIVLSNSVALCAALALLWDGHLLFSAGFQLSFAVLIAIVLLGRYVSRVFAWISYSDPFLPRSLYSRREEASVCFRRKVEGATVVGSCAWCGSSPLTWWHFGLLTPVSVLVSLPMVLILYFVLVLTAVSLFVGSFSRPLSDGVNAAGRFFAGRALAVASASAPSHVSEAEWSEGERVVVYSLTDGQAAVYLGIGGGVMLDVGSERGFRAQVLPSLRRKGAAVDSLILSHADVNHHGGSAALLEHFKLKQVVLPVGLWSESENWAGVDSLLAKTAQNLELASGARLEVIYAATEKRGVADDRCSVMRLHWHGKKVLFLNDAGFQFEQWVEQNGMDVSADVLVIGCHGSDHSGSVDFIKRVAPSLVILSQDAVQSERWESELTDAGVELMLLENTGAVEMQIEQDTLLLKGFLAGEKRIH